MVLVDAVFCWHLRICREQKCSITCSYNLGTRWKWVVSLNPLPLCPCRKKLMCLSDRRLCGPQDWSDCCGERRNVCHWQEPKPGSSVVQSVPWSLFWLSCCVFPLRSNYETCAVPLFRVRCHVMWCVLSCFFYFPPLSVSLFPHPQAHDTYYVVGYPGFDSQHGQKILLFSKQQNCLWGPPSLLFIGYWRVFHWQ